MPRQTFYYPIHNSDPKMSKRPWVIGYVEVESEKWSANYLCLPLGPPILYTTKEEVMQCLDKITYGTVIREVFEVNGPPSVQDRIDFVQASLRKKQDLGLSRSNRKKP